MVIAIIMTLIVTAGVKKSVTFNNILNVVNLVVWVFMIAGGLFFLNGSNWSEDGFLPFGFSGVGFEIKSGKSAGGKLSPGNFYKNKIFGLFSGALYTEHTKVNHMTHPKQM